MDFLPKHPTHIRTAVKNAICRCIWSNHGLWKYYGGRGICVYLPWLDNPGEQDPAPEHYARCEQLYQYFHTRLARRKQRAELKAQQQQADQLKAILHLLEYAPHNKDFVKIHCKKLKVIRKMKACDSTWISKEANSNRQYAIWIEHGKTDVIPEATIQRFLGVYLRIAKEIYEKRSLIMTLEQLIQYSRNKRYIARHFAHLRQVRESVCSAAAFARSIPTHVTYVYRIEAGKTKGIGAQAIQRILEAYSKLEGAYEGADGPSEPRSSKAVERSGG